MLVSDESVQLKPWLRAPTTLAKRDVRCVEVLKVRQPLVWRTLFRFRLHDGSLATRKFIAARAKAAHQAFLHCGWPTIELQRGIRPSQTGTSD
jgi:hypothetical protein